MGKSKYDEKLDIIIEKLSGIEARLEYMENKLCPKPPVRKRYVSIMDVAFYRTMDKINSKYDVSNDETIEGDKNV